MRIINKLICISMVFLLFTSCSKSRLTDLKIKECDSGNQQACIHLAQEYPNDINQSTQYYLKACHLNAAEGCTKVALNYLLTLQNGTSQALPLFEKSCLLDATKKGCFWLGSLASNGFLVPQNYQNAIRYWDQACMLGDLDSCLALGDSFRDGKGVNRDYDKAIRAYHQGCQKNDISACVRLTEVKEAVKSSQNNEFLYQEALKYEFGLSGQGENFSKAYSLFLEACNKGSSKACMKLATYYENNSRTLKNINKSYEFYNKSCDLGDYKGCTRAGALVIERGGSSDKNRELASSLWEKSCQAKDMEACSLLKQLQLMVKNSSNTSDQERACNDGSYTDCYELGKLYLYGEKIPKNIPAAKKLLTYACNNYVQAACVTLQELEQKITDSSKGSVNREEFDNRTAQERKHCTSDNNATDDCSSASSVIETQSQPVKTQKSPTSNPKEEDSKLEELLF